MPRRRRTSRQVETRLVSEFLAVRYPEAVTMQRVRVGSLHPSLEIPGLRPEERRLVGVWRRWVDAVIIEPEQVTLLEGAVYPDPGDIAQLELYLRLWPATPEMQRYRHLPTRGALLYAIPDPAIHQLARERGYAVWIYHPPWVDGYLLSLAARRRRAPLTAL